jgi:dTDP-4-dehydrorhamnose 3,5-epimerase
MKFIKTEISGVFIIEPELNLDSRGYFGRFFCKQEAIKAGIDFDIVQINKSFTQNKGTIRGFHYQNHPMWEEKIVQCTKGSIYDVVVDIRKDSPTYMKWISFELSEENKKMVYTSKGIMNGFQSLTDGCELLYFMSQYYSPEHGSGIRFDDPSLNVNWPIANPILSERDKKLPFLKK